LRLTSAAVADKHSIAAASHSLENGRTGKKRRGKFAAAPEKTIQTT